MLAPLHWHDYKKKHGKLDEFVASHPDLREGAQEIIAATAAVAKVAAAAAAPSSFSSMLPSVAVTPMAQSHRLKKFSASQSQNGGSFHIVEGVSNVKILSKSKDHVELNGSETRPGRSVLLTVGNGLNSETTDFPQSKGASQGRPGMSLVGRQQSRTTGAASNPRRYLTIWTCTMPSFPHLQKFSLSPFPITTLASSTTATSTATSTTTQFVQFQFSTPRFLSKRIVAVAAASGDSSMNRDQPSVVLDSLRVLQWDQLCDCVASFAGTSLGKKAVKEQLWNLDKAYEDSVRLLEETSAAVEMQKYGAIMEFSGIDVSLVESGIKCARRGFPVSGSEAMALVTLLQFADALQLNVKAAIKEDSDWFRRFMPLSEMIMELFISQPLIKFIEQLVDEDGSVKDSASSNLRHARDQVRFLERKVIVDMERFKQDYHNKIHEAQHYMRLSRKLHQSLLLTRKRVMEHGMEERYRMMQEISEAAASARSITHKKVRESRSVRIQPSKQIKADKDSPSSTPVHLHAPAEKNGTSPATDTACSMDNTKPSITDKKLELPKVGDLVNVPSLNKKATVLKLDLSKEELVVQAGNLKLKLKLADIVT
ncbi:UNVERIFIED_CONTAM: hypothetical protein Scaly_2457100 [Sesamum calycinum]|uniref:Uncharacterized protein n=1 Tax=Sesamum calycinum TaxID=2727403 RepID=A0AAW2LS34_9LAMI